MHNYIRTHTHTHAYPHRPYIHPHVNTLLHANLNTYKNTRAYICTNTNTCAQYTHKCMHSNSHKNPCTYSLIYNHTHHLYADTHTHSHMHSHFQTCTRYRNTDILIYSLLRTCTYKTTHTHAHSATHLPIHTHLHTNTLVLTFYIYVYVQTCTFAHINTCMHTRIHLSPACTYEKTHTFTQKCPIIY